MQTFLVSEIEASGEKRVNETNEVAGCEAISYDRTLYGIQSWVMKFFKKLVRVQVQHRGRTRAGESSVGDYYPLEGRTFAR